MQKLITSVSLSKPLPSDIGSMVPKQEKNLTGTVLDPQFVRTGLGYIRLPAKALTLEGREHLWPQGTGVGESSLTEEEMPDDLSTDVIEVPYVSGFSLISSHQIIHPILNRANNILKVIRMLARGELGLSELQTSVSRYQDELVSELAGKQGLLNRAVLGVRTPNSGRFVIMPDPELDYTQTGVPESVMRTANISEGDLILISRAPVLWEGSVLIQKAVRVEGYAGSLNPFVMDLMGADFDGDTVAVMKIPGDIDCQVEAAMLLGATIRDHAKWSSEFLMWNDDKQVDWNDPGQDVDSRLYPESDMFTYTLSPEDVLNPDESDVIQNMKETGCKSPPSDLADYAEGLDRQRFVTTTQDVVGQLTRMKVELGMIGAITDKVAQVIYVVDRNLLPKALKLKEKLTQALLDSKHGLDAFDTFGIANLFNRRGEWSPDNNLPLEAASGYLEASGIPVDIVRPLIQALWSLDEGVQDIVNSMPMYQASRKLSRKDLLSIKSGEQGTGFLQTLAGMVGLEDHL